MKIIVSSIVLLALYGGILIWKNGQIEEKKNTYIPTTYDLQKKNGIPVFVDKVERGKFQDFITISGTIRDGQLKSAVAPFIKNKIRVGAGAKVEFNKGKKQVNGRVSSVSSGPSLLTGLYEVTVNFDQRLPKDLGAVTVDIPVKEVNNVIVVPREAVSVREVKPVVFILENNRLTKKFVQIAGANADVFWIKSGLSQDETVVTSDTRYFSGGELVKVMNETREEL
ncbi:MAG: hypothetical protein NDI69_04460 [Bacteriovoracaceae bacterium]|nr:hypothetical protein [Bacteriovoracaceae bacterium]